MRIEGSDGANWIEVTLAGYEFPDEIIERETMNWLETDLRVRTFHGRGVSRVALMRTWDAADFAHWLESLSAAYVGSESIMIFPEPNLQMKAVRWPAYVAIDIYFILEQPGQWDMNDAFYPTSSHHYVGNMTIDIALPALHAAAASLRSDLLRFPVREPNT